MYEIWLVINILWELVLENAAPVVGIVLVWVLLTALALRRRDAGWGRALPLAIGVGAAVTALAFVLVPPAVGSSFADMGYWVDWANLVAIALGVGGVAAAVAWPLGALRCG